MRRFVLSAVAVATATGFTLLTGGVAHADWPDPVGTCHGAFHLQTLNPDDPGYNPDSPAHRDRNGDGWLCFNGHAWKDDNTPH